MNKFLVLLLLISQVAVGQKLKKSDKAVIKNLQSHVGFLANDKLEGRRAGTNGEKLASDYIISQFAGAGIQPMGSGGGYLQPFQIAEGKQVLPTTHFIVDNQDLKLESDFFPLAFSSNSGAIESVVSPSLSESGQPWFLDLGDMLLNNKDNPHFDLASQIKNEIVNARKKGANALILHNSSTIEDQLKFDGKDKSETAEIPVVYVRKDAVKKVFPDPAAAYDLKLKVEMGPRSRTANNIIGYINNNAPMTIVIGAHYDHLGYGEDGNSMNRTGEKLIHNGADDNASGSAGLIEMARMLKKYKTSQSNFLFIAFSGEELGLYGSKYFVENPTLPLNTVNFMINMDMIGRLNDSTKTITIGGYGTSPAWSSIVKVDKKMPFGVKFDSSGTGPSDHTSFYRKDIPVLFFFTGLHTDYHKPSDDAEKINYTGEYYILRYIYGIIEKSGQNGKLAFTKTREQQTTTSARFSVSMGIMPDYTFSGSGVRVDGVSEGRPAQKAGLKAGDVVTRLGEYAVTSVESYMQALSKFKKGDTTKVVVRRGTEDLTFDIGF